jgi:hypothetical protein
MEQGPTDTASKIFESHFRRVLEPAEYDRARAVFDNAGAYNERSLAIQIQTALQAGKFDEVLSSYEELLANPDFQELDFVSRSVYLRRYADYIYGVLITEGSPVQIMDQIETMRLPGEMLEIFDQMS